VLEIEVEREAVRLADVFGEKRFHTSQFFTKARSATMVTKHALP
jgi:hypothetical protein